MGMEYLERWSAGGWLSKSPAEERFALILESGPYTDARAAFAHAGGWLVALRAIATVRRHGSRVGAAQEQLRHGVELPAIVQARS